MYYCPLLALESKGAKTESDYRMELSCVSKRLSKETQSYQERNGGGGWQVANVKKTPKSSRFFYAMNVLSTLG